MLIFYKIISFFIQTVNLYYNTGDNSINSPAGILQPPLFDAQQPDYLNYGAIGSLIGHELTHAFDSTGSLYDVNGFLNNWVIINKSENIIFIA